MTTRYPLLRSIAVFAIVMYVAIVVCLQVIWRTPAINIWWVQLLNVFGMWLYLPLPFLFLLSFLARPRSVAALLLVPLLFFGWEYRWMLQSDRTPEAGIPIRVMSWNLLFHNTNIDAMDSLIRQYDPDVLAVQEYSFRQSLQLDRRLGQRYPYHALAPGGASGLGVWSRYPIRDWSVVDDRRLGCACQRMLIDLPGQTIRFVNAHPKAPGIDVRRRVAGWSLPVGIISGFRIDHQEPAIAALVEMAQSNGPPLVVAGDLNTHDRQPNYWRLRRYYRDAFRDVGHGFGLTFPADEVYVGPFRVPPLVRIDYVLFTEGIGATFATTATGPGSDHRAVVADLVVRRADARLVPLPRSHHLDPTLEGVVHGQN